MAQYEIDNLPSPIEFVIRDPVARILQNAKNLLMCRMGEIPYDRYRGLDQSLLDLPVGEMRERLMPELDRCMLWSMGAEVTSAEINIVDGGGIYIRVILEIPFG